MAAFALDKHFNSSPLFYQRYVDDIFAVCNTKSTALNFVEHINTLYPGLKFTAEHSIYNGINFLDLNIKCINGQINTNCHIKGTNTAIYLPKISFSPIQYKTAAIHALIYRAYRLSI